MDPLSGGASVLAFIGILNSLQLIYETLSSVKDGPEHVRQAASSVGQLRAVLKQLQRQQYLNDPDGDSQLKQCADDVETIAGEIARLRISPSEKRSGRIWKRIKTALKEKDIDHMNKVLDRHTAALGLQLVVQQRDVVVECRDQILSLQSSVTNQREKPSSGHSGDAAPALQSQVDTMLQILRQLQAQIPNRAPTQSSVVEPGNGGMVATATTRASDTSVSHHLDDTINKLCVLIGDKEQTIRSDDANDIIQRLEKLLKNFTCTTTDPTDSDRCKRMKDLERASRLLRSSTRLSINKKARQNVPPSGAVVWQERRRNEINIETGCLAISTIKRKHRLTEQGEVIRCSVSTKTEEEMDAESFFASFVFFPSESSARKSILAMSISQHERIGGALLPFPCISVHRVRPRESPVFQLVREGNLDALRKALGQGTASVRDHDEDGRSLLFYATQQPEVCRFLIESGLDVEYMAPRVPYGGWSKDQPKTMDSEGPVPLLRVELADEDEDPAALERINRCRQLLLEAGADPSMELVDHGYPFTPFERSFAGGVIDSMKVFLDAGSYFTDIETHDVRGEGKTPLLQHCEGEGYGYYEDSLAFLLKRGANVNAVDARGRSCLHIAIEGSRGPFRLEEEFAAMALLIRSGADVYGKDGSGRSVSETAYHRSSFDFLDRDLGSYWGDFWDAVLAACGYQVSDFRQNSPRAARYTKRYPRLIFLRFWEGREYLCPYWGEDHAAYGSDTVGHHDEDRSSDSDQYDEHETEIKENADERRPRKYQHPDASEPCKPVGRTHRFMPNKPSRDDPNLWTVIHSEHWSWCFQDG